ARQIRRTFFLMLASIFVLSIGFVIYLVAILTPAEFLLQAVRTFTTVSSSAQDAQQFLEYLLRISPPAIPILLGLAAAGWVLVLSLTWFFTIMRFSTKGENNQ
ncbi:MAG TPA: hypothetical protein VFF68_10495, partial [Anaerolineaceae bacterium]|nr:hypothetical protein [Anaerolineaceae bacterium]